MSKWRFLFSSTSGYGHFHTLVPLARALKEAGHAVAFAMDPSRRATLEAEGFTFFPVGPSIRPDPEYQEVKAKLQEMPLDLEYELYAYPRIFCGISTRLKTPAVVEVGRKWQPDMFIREAGEYSAIIAAELMGVPHAVVAFSAALKSHTIFEKEAAAFLDPVRKDWGLEPDPTLASLYRYLTLSYSPLTFSLGEVGRAGGSIPATTHFIRPEFYDRSTTESLPAWITELPEQPTVYATLGTEVNKEPDLYPRVLQIIIEGLRSLPVNLIVTLGRDKDPAEFGEQPANVHIERYIPQSLLLPHCDLMVMHSGSNTLLEALHTALPTVAVPLIADQFFNAHVLQNLQLGQVVQLGQLTPASIRGAVEEVLANPRYRQNLLKLQAEMNSLPDQKYAVELIERVASEGKPLLNTALPGEPQ